MIQWMPVESQYKAMACWNSLYYESSLALRVQYQSFISRFNKVVHEYPIIVRLVREAMPIAAFVGLNVSEGIE